MCILHHTMHCVVCGAAYSLVCTVVVSLSLLRASIASRSTDRISTLLHNTCAKNQFWWMFFFLLFFPRFIVSSCVEKQQPEQQLKPNSNIDNKSERTHSIYGRRGQNKTKTPIVSLQPHTKELQIIIPYTIHVATPKTCTKLSIVNKYFYFIS